MDLSSSLSLPLLPRGPPAAGYKNCRSLHQMRCFALLLLLPHCDGGDEAPPPVHPSSLPRPRECEHLVRGRPRRARRGGPREGALAKRPFAAPSAVPARPAGRSDAAARRRSARRRSWKTHRLKSFWRIEYIRTYNVEMDLITFICVCASPFIGRARM